MSAVSTKRHWCIYFPLAYSLITAAAVSCILLVAGDSTASAILLFAVEIWVIYLTVVYTLDYVYERASGWISIIAFFDIFVAQGIGFAGVWFGIYILDPSQFWDAGDVFGGGGGVSVWRGYLVMLFSAYGLLTSVGYATVIPRGVFSELWAIFGYLQSVWWLAILLSGNIRQRLRLPQ